MLSVFRSCRFNISRIMSQGITFFGQYSYSDRSTIEDTIYLPVLSGRYTLTLSYPRQFWTVFFTLGQSLMSLSRVFCIFVFFVSCAVMDRKELNLSIAIDCKCHHACWSKFADVKLWYLSWPIKTAQLQCVCYWSIRPTFGQFNNTIIFSLWCGERYPQGL